MITKVKCPSCSQPIEAEGNLLGQSVDCPGCETEFVATLATFGSPSIDARKKYLLCIDDREDGPFELEQIRKMLDRGDISPWTLAIAEDHTGEWIPVANISKPPEPKPQPEPIKTPPPSVAAIAPASPSPPAIRQAEPSDVATVLTIIASLELIAAPIAGFLVGDTQSSSLGWMIFLSGFLSGLILLGFAKVIEHLYESTQRLRQIEFLLQKADDAKNVVQSSKD